MAAGSGAHAADYPLPATDSRLIGENFIHTVPRDGKPLEATAARFQIGLLGMLEANPGVDPFLPRPGSELIIPAQMLLPDAPREGIVINLAELRLFYYPPGENRVEVYPIGIGQLGRNTPEMVTRVSQHIKDPTWTPTANIRRNYQAQGITLPAVMPAGPDNPMGRFALRLAAQGGVYLIHGTNADFGIGMRVSSGCIRLRPDDIEALFRSVPGGTRVQIVNQPVKTSVEPDGKRYVEVHQPLSRSERDDPQTMPIALNGRLSAFAASPLTDRAAFEGAMARRSGMPVLVSHAVPVNDGAAVTTQAAASAPAPVTTPASTSTSAPAPIDAALPEAVLNGR
ncbi:L,D-transpeptidase family protein [Edwardsiella anguillarum]|nr:L,D-transpeptidase family protein [Edwardsiella sp. LADL05-105]UOU80903.1 L,D-transpeptidase family protein [Edwardsiella anguillarum]WHP82071.1 L,D-transpeptidase family protein [Edwardsiella anguillarum]WHP85797.1 L,D-transpeptidase family protein [Edwardsiella anguillarum]WHP89586.1 L,D-transpeptidase family protein [Edwardsiella anguillarum]